jgi:hypothetical protein
VFYHNWQAEARKVLSTQIIRGYNNAAKLAEYHHSWYTLGFDPHFFKLLSIDFMPPA